MKRYEEIEKKSEQEAKRLVADLFPQRAYLYAVLDYGVCFGLYENSCFYIGSGECKSKKLLDWRYLKELRIFNTSQELKLVYMKDYWAGRIRRDLSDGETAAAAREYVIDERQKLWGTIKHEQEGELPEWSFLVSERGTRLLIPINSKKRMGDSEVAVIVRKYMRIPNMETEQELVYQTDMRMVDFCPWNIGGERNE